MCKNHPAFNLQCQAHKEIDLQLMKIAQLLSKASSLTGCKLQGKVLEEQFNLDKQERQERLSQFAYVKEYSNFPTADIISFLAGTHQANLRSGYEESTAVSLLLCEE